MIWHEGNQLNKRSQGTWLSEGDAVILDKLHPNKPLEQSSCTQLADPQPNWFYHDATLFQIGVNKVKTP